MSPPAPSARPELWTYRALCLAGGVTVPLLGWAHQVYGPGPVLTDPLWLRLVVGALPLGLALVSFVSEGVRREIAGLTYVLLYVYVGWFAAIAGLGGFTSTHAVGGVALVVAVSVASTSGFARLWPLVAGLVTTVGALALVLALVDAPAVAPGPYLAVVSASALGLLAGAALWRHRRAHAEAGEQRYRTVFERVADGVVLLDAATLRVVAANEAYLRLTGFNAQEVHARTLYDLALARRDEVDRDVRLAAEAANADLGERVHRRLDGTEIPLAVGLARLEEGGRPLLCLTARDLSEEKRTRTELESSRDQARAMLELRTNFLNNMSHELRTPLVAITGFLDLLQAEGDHLDPEERGAMLDSLRRSAERLTGTLNAVLDLAQLEGGQFNLAPEPIDIQEVAREVSARLLPHARTRGLDLRLRVGVGDSALALADRGALERILLGLLSNALKFTPRGSVTVTVEADSHRVLLHVSDTGIGIGPEALPHLFTPFRQVSAGLGREHEGSGLGLTLTKRLVDLMGGRIKVESAPGKGTTVTVAFARTWGGVEADLLEPAAEAGPADPWAERGGDGAVGIAQLAARPRALVVEDNLDTARLMQRMLRDHFDVDTAPDAETALALARKAWYDVAFLDMHLGSGMNGLGLLHHLRAMSAYAFVPAIAVTAYGAAGDRERFLGAGFDAYLPKPFTKPQLLGAAQAASAAQAHASAVA
jgi:PAS domain S-box-containing protein